MKEKAGTPRAKKPFQMTLIGPEPTPKTPAKPPKKPARPAPPTIPEWRALYAAAIRFKELGCWEWLCELDMFGVRNPEGDGVIGYCSVMGILGEHFALAAYLGSKGLTGFQRIQSGAVAKTEVELYELQDCLMVSFEDRKYITPKDYKVMRELGLKFRGANAWPMVRRLRPGRIPWYIDGAEARFLTVALEQALEVAPRVQADPIVARSDVRRHCLFGPDQDGRYLVRTADTKAGTVVWQDEWLKPEPLTAAEMALQEGILLPTEDYLASLRNSVTKRYGDWELDISWLPEPVQDERGTAPFFPRLFMVVDSENGIVIGTAMSKPDDYVREFGEEFARVVKQLEGLPSGILVRNDATEAFIVPVSQALRIPLKRTRLKQVAKIKRELEKMLSLNATRR